MKARPGATPMIVLGLVFWVFGGVFAAYGPEGNVLGVILGLVGVVAFVVAVAIRVCRPRLTKGDKSTAV
ncbi:hypothetical protein SAMN05428965_1623 [Geodermatophilus sp. DSM 45219]|nr:hypothetical protein SAMN05428965_1623 [Geodermatophilus sp. DSM 45219]